MNRTDKATVRHALDVLSAINQFFLGNNPVHPGALLMDDDRTIKEHVEESIANLYEVTK